ncbi:NUDIX domain-containing protein [Chryseobacterium taklimakanense]|uniref:Nucleoside triphosphate pyrophosphohydrolase n=1 Tax=Chryseobacterium taklimakanense TaxID=536441 RepID=A0A239WBZ8_9FLAO|nr:NUDIX domain-containing protein [Chryseobacterium taklimakanense]AZI22627.1 NUDIX domain-containing protein [Chryseobacterium taklimakanense]SNV31443.1 nucleoside triphosphate pyrophosphohydrolase [Chryseobacterium taklimakanense]
MYKVFVNEKKLTISKYPADIEKNLRYEGFATLEIAIDLLENTSCPQMNVYGEEIEEIWEDFTHMFRVVEAAGGIVSNKEGKILFIHRLGKWDLPKGKIEKDESLEQAALREVEEETALQELILEEFVNNTFHVYKERNGDRILKTTYWFKMSYVGEKDPVPQTEEGITEVSWKNQDEIQQEVFPKTFQNIKLILKTSGTVMHGEDEDSKENQ